MRLLFAHDHRFFRGPAGEMYTSGSFPAQAWDRYIEHFDHIDIIARDGGAIGEPKDLARSDREGVSFQFLPNLSTAKRLVIRSAQLEDRMRSAVAAADAVVARLPSEIGLLAVRHARRAGKPYAVEVVGCAWDGTFNYGAAGGRIYAPLFYLRNRRAIASAPFALYVTSTWLQKRYPTHGRQGIASNVNLPPFPEAAARRRQQRLKAIAKQKRPVLGTVASLHTRSKGIQTALRALSTLKREGLELRYRVLGPGPVEPWAALAEQLGVADLVSFDGTRGAGAGVAEWLDEIDVHLQPSFQEGLPRGTIEAMSRGAACIGSTCGGIPELLPAERLHRPGDAAGLADRIRQLVTDPDRLAEASRADLAMASQFDPKELKRRRSRFYAQLRDLAEASSS
jgi:glycosyltransferase involved in cell wall biosynthesis